MFNGRHRTTCFPRRSNHVEKWGSCVGGAVASCCRKKITAAEQLVQGQLDSGYSIPSNSPLESPISLLKRRSGKWRLSQDPRKLHDGSVVSGIAHAIGYTQSYIRNYSRFNNCSYTTPSAPEGSKRFAFGVPSTSFKVPMRRYQGTVSPQGMANGPTVCRNICSSSSE